MKLKFSLLAVGISTAMIYAQGTAPAPSVQPPAPAVQPPAPAVQPPAPAVQPPAPAVQPPAAAVQPPAAAVQPPAAAVQPPAAAVQPPAPAVQPPAPAVQPPAPAVQPPARTVQPPTGTVQPPTGTVQPPTGTVQPPTGTVQPPTGTVQPPAGTVQPPGTAVQQPGATGQQPGLQTPTATPPIQPLPDPRPFPQLNLPQTALPPLTAPQAVNVQRLPAGVRQAITAHVGNVPVQVQQGSQNGQPVFQVTFTDQGRQFALQMRPDGTVLTPAIPLGQRSTGQALTAGQLPAGVVEALTTRFGNVPVSQLRLINQNGTPLYEIQYLQDGVPVRALLTSEGQIVSTGIAPQTGVVGTPGVVAPGGVVGGVPGVVQQDPTFAEGQLLGQEIIDPAGGQPQPQPQPQQNIQRPRYQAFQPEEQPYPESVQRAVRRETQGAQVQSVDRKTTSVFVVRFDKDGKETELRVLPDGRLLPGNDRGEAGEFSDPLVNAREMTFDETPFAIQETLRERAGLALIDELKSGEVLGRRVYEAEFTREGKLTKVRLDSEGRLIGLREKRPAVARERSAPTNIELRESPEPVRQTIQRHTEGVALKSLIREPLDIYTFVLDQNGIPFELHVAENGTLLRGPALPETAIQMSEVPAPVRETVRQPAPPRNLRIVNSPQETPGENVDRDAQRDQARIDEAAGGEVRTARKVQLEHLPPAVRVTMQTVVSQTREAGAGELREVRQIERFGKPVYEGIYMVNGREHRVLVGQDGGIILPESHPDSGNNPDPQ
jgi:hypothetical protein